MLFNFKFLSNKQLKKLDRELAKVNYDELLGGLQQLTLETQDSEELRVIYAIEQCCLELRKIYKEDK